MSDTKPNPPVQVTCFLLLFLSPTIIHSKPIWQPGSLAAVGAGAVGAGATAAAAIIWSGAAAAWAALAPVGAAAAAAAPNLLLGKALVGSGFLIWASVGSKELSSYIYCS